MSQPEPEPRRIAIFDTTLRDGEQSPGVALTAAGKLQIARTLDALRVDVIEAGFAAASSGDFAAIRAIAGAVEHATVCSLARCKESDIRAAAEAVAPARRRRVHTFIAASPIHRRHKLNMTPAQVLKALRQGVALAAELCPEVEFSAEDATRTEPEFLAEAALAAVEAGARIVNIPDTVGYTTPAEYRELLAGLRRVLPSHVVLSVHCHDDLGMAVANSLAGVLGGAGQVECTLNGLGERAGNAALEEVVMALRTRHDVFGADTAIRAAGLCEASALASRLSGFAVPPNKAVVGANAFAHESGIHQHGMIGHRSTYEIMRAGDVGADSRLTLGKLSGRHAMQHRLRALGIVMADAQAERVFARMKAAADAGTPIDDDALRAMARAEAQAQPAEIADLQVTAADSRHTVRLKVRRGSGQGQGKGTARTAAKAIARAVARALGLEFRLESCRTGEQALGDGTAWVAEAAIKTAQGRFHGQAQGAAEHEAIAHAIAHAAAVLGGSPRRGSVERTARHA
ncbi:MAG: 2-isopropylmalate synthase [Planctomycetes bacterium]|nr:2-isopropylmalate synthase [Planctomycetota bacterium]